MACLDIFLSRPSLPCIAARTRTQLSKALYPPPCRSQRVTPASSLPDTLSYGTGLRFQGLRAATNFNNNNKLIYSQKMLSKGVATAEVRTPQFVEGVVESVKWAFASPPTWESAALATTTIFVAAAPILLAGLSLSGYCSAFLLGLLTWRAFGGQGIVIVSLYFLLGTAATKVKIKQKEAAGIAEKKSGRRGPGSVWGSGTAGALCAVASISGVGGFKWEMLWRLGFLASFCTKLSDTISSEIGKAYGKTTYLVTTFSIVPRGTEGAVSLEGTFAGLVASVILAAVACSMNLTDQSGAIICVVGAQVANLCESYIGAALQGREGYEWYLSRADFLNTFYKIAWWHTLARGGPADIIEITNDIANVLNISIGALLAILIRSLTG